MRETRPNLKFQKTILGLLNVLLTPLQVTLMYKRGMGRGVAGTLINSIQRVDLISGGMRGQLAALVM